MHRLISFFIGLFICQPVIAETTLKYASWNIEWLTTNTQHSLSNERRSSQDFAALSSYFVNLAPDVLAFQEVDSSKAISKVVGDNYYVVMSQRSEATHSHQQFKEINQYTGFAIRKGVNFENQSDVPLTSNTSSKLRHATYVVVNPETRSPIHVLSVHLKARCVGAYRTNRHCATLKQQSQHLNKWIVDRENKRQSYVILGDFNHNLSYEGDWFWSQMTRSTNAVLVTKNVKPRCQVRSKKNPKRTRTYPSVIDHIVISESLTGTNATQHLYASNTVPNYQMSDHCAVTAVIKP